MFSEELLIWIEIKNAASNILKTGGNPIEVLLWSKGKTLEEVKFRLHGEKPDKPATKERNKEESLYLKQKIADLKISEINIEEIVEYEIEIDREKSKKIKEMVEFEEKSFKNGDKYFAEVFI